MYVLKKKTWRTPTELTTKADWLAWGENGHREVSQSITTVTTNYHSLGGVQTTEISSAVAQTRIKTGRRGA